MIIPLPFFITVDYTLHNANVAPGLWAPDLSLGVAGAN